VSAASRPEPPLDPLGLLRTLTEHGVDFVVIGGFSLAAHGFVRATKDVDVVPEPSRRNLERLLEALESVQAEPLAVGDSEADEILELTLDNLSGGGNWLLRTAQGRLDVMQYVEGLGDYAELRNAAITPEIPGLEARVAFAGYDDLIAMKQAAGRDQDLIDIAELERRRSVG
jgi:hypothetical protein